MAKIDFMWADPHAAWSGIACEIELFEIEIKILTFICFTSSYSSVQRCSKANCLKDIMVFTSVLFASVLNHNFWSTQWRGFCCSHHGRVLCFVKNLLMTISISFAPSATAILISCTLWWQSRLHQENKSITISAKDKIYFVWEQIKTSVTWSLVVRGIWPLGKPVATAATGMSSALYLGQI